MNEIEIQVVKDIDKDKHRIFDYVVPISLPLIFPGYGNFAAIINTSNVKKWNKAGLSRLVTFADGTSAFEELLTVTQDESFAYRISKFTSPLKYLANKIEGQWLFTEIGKGKTRISWSYKIFPKNQVAKLLLNLFVVKDLKGMLNQALDIIDRTKGAID